MWYAVRETDRYRVATSQQFNL
uniref:Uncharacterized protein n=1 Tax=Anopheles minimus TaxID=112268 RepID=A0A182WNX3_9DIPT